MSRIVMGFCAGAGDKEGRTPTQINLEDNAYTRRCLDALYNPRHVPTKIAFTQGMYGLYMHDSRTGFDGYPMCKGYRIDSLYPFRWSVYRCEYGGFDE